MDNQDIRRIARAEGIPMWRIAKALGISEPTMTRRMRQELPENEKEKLKVIIRNLSEEER